MSDNPDIVEGVAAPKKTTQKIKAITQKIALAEEKLEEAISQEIDSVEKGAKKVDQAVSSFGSRHPILLTILIVVGLFVLFWLVGQYYANQK